MIDIIFDSDQEYCFYNWLLQLKDVGVVQTIVYQPDSFKLFDGLIGLNKNKKKQINILRPHVYTADFLVKFNKNLLTKYFNTQNLFSLNQYIDFDQQVYFEIKGGYNQFQSVSNFSINQKWVYQIYKTIIQKIVPDQLFSKSFVPQKIRITQKTKKVKSKYVNLPILTQIIV